MGLEASKAPVRVTAPGDRRGSRPLPLVSSTDDRCPVPPARRRDAKHLDRGNARKRERTDWTFGANRT